MQYSLSETGPWTACTADIPAEDFGWDGAEPVTVYFRAVPGDNYPGEPVELTIPARPAAPAVEGGAGRIAGADKSMEYSTDGGANWTPFTDETLGRMEPGEYQVRYAAAESSFRSEAVPVTVAPGGQGVNVPETYEIELIAGDGGEAKTSLSNASAGTKITVTATPDEGYELAYITVDGERISGASFTMPDHDVTVRVYFTDAAAPVFVDVGSADWFYGYVQYVAQNGLMEGTGEGRFEPDGAMTRAMFWAVLARIDGETITGDSWKNAGPELGCEQRHFGWHERRRADHPRADGDDALPLRGQPRGRRHGDKRVHGRRVCERLRHRRRDLGPQRGRPRRHGRRHPGPAGHSDQSAGRGHADALRGEVRKRYENSPGGHPPGLFP